MRTKTTALSIKQKPPLATGDPDQQMVVAVMGEGQPPILPGRKLGQREKLYLRLLHAGLSLRIENPKGHSYTSGYSMFVILQVFGMAKNYSGVTRCQSAILLRIHVR